ncbi:peptidyl-prolyl cis-trans isomerase [Lysobacter dokdonensis DS-58]|uniref:Peptidyl-prolyl cis-trans isomerase n=1 Tax=Lysobacter dokdonensis DS-58 TaxID=1300345 RepID=A0A0A2WHZ4_9GAMM|nr:FKBP-type peptidyl-prolyl cis-trans isomerase N-terminal domain-containing protein [Lysobacter dokdonensis]KGQ19806.1 peptidyl-prolyl cis-trans isomerase [Lysobacter dokdonensis DS-58]
MKLRLLAATVAALTLATGFAQAQDTTSEKGKLSYYFGYRFGSDLAASGEQVDMATVYKAMQDAYAKKQPAIAEKDLEPVIAGLQKRQKARADQRKAEFEKASADNKAKSDQFLAANKAKQGVKTLPSGVQYRVIETGSGAKPTNASTVDLEVTGPFPLNQRPQTAPAAEKLTGIKMSEVEMKGMREALSNMPAGSKWEIALPPDQGFGNDPRSPYPPNVAVVFEVKLVSAK